MNNVTPSAVQEPTIISIFGATGDLASRKIFPALWHLFERNRCPENMVVIGIARRALSHDEFKRVVADAVRTHDSSIDEDMLTQFLSQFFYHAGNFNDVQTYTGLKDAIDACEEQWHVCSNKLMYMAVGHDSYTPIFDGIANVGLNTACGGESGWTRILVEKPFGKDANNSKQLQSLLAQYFTEEQIYRIDHYLFKEIVQGIENFRFSNNLFENQWGSELIESVTLRLNETIDVSGRGSFYDSVGALRDVGQNHLLAILSLLTADYAAQGDARNSRTNRAALLETLAPWTKDTVQKNTKRFQYEGYRSIEGVTRNSQTETYFTLETQLNHPRWKGVPIYMEAGKALKEASKEIVLTLKHASPCLLCEVGPHAPNRIVFRLEPRDEVVIYFWTKKPGFDKVIEERELSFFLYEKENKTQYVEEYATLFYDAMQGDQSLFVSADEVQAEWEFVDPVVEAWQAGLVPLSHYKPGTTPASALATKSDTTGGEVYSQGTLGIVGLGKMGANLARRLSKRHWQVRGYNRSPEAVQTLVDEGVIIGASSVDELVKSLPTPRTLWLMVPHGVVDAALEEIIPLLESGDTVIDGGNSFFKDSIRRAEMLKGKGILFLGAGVSGGPSGALEGASIMVGGEKEVFRKHEQLFKDMAAPNAYQFFDGAGTGHFVKMVHNGIEYGMMQSLAEGFSVMKAYSPTLNLKKVADVYNHSSVIESRLVGWLKDAFTKYGKDLDVASGSVAHTGEGQWTVQIAKELNVPVPVIKSAFDFRVESETKPSYAGKILSALRNQFGGHDINH